jgi:hypothetical protein
VIAENTARHTGELYSHLPNLIFLCPCSLTTHTHTHTRAPIPLACPRFGVPQSPLATRSQDLTRLRSEAIVHSTNETLSESNEEAKRLHAVAGPELLAACQLIANCRTGDVKWVACPLSCLRRSSPLRRNAQSDDAPMPRTQSATRCKARHVPKQQSLRYTRARKRTPHTYIRTRARALGPTLNGRTG